MEAACVMNPSAQRRKEVPLEGRRVVVAGLARTGMASVRFLISRGAEVVVLRPQAGRRAGSRGRGGPPARVALIWARTPSPPSRPPTW